jgi:hypothetical protein
MVVVMVIRPAQASDWRYVIPRFISSFREASTHAEGLTGKQIASALTGLVLNGWQTLIVDYEGVIAAWVIFAPKNHLAWVYVRPELGFRGQGLAKLLLEKAGIDIGKPVTSPFVPNRHKHTCKLRLTIHHRPFLVLPREDNAKKDS